MGASREERPAPWLGAALFVGLAGLGACTSGIDLSEEVPACGDGRREGREGCDDGNRAAGDGCSPVCVQERGFVCVAPACACDRAPACDADCGCDPACDGGRSETLCAADLACASTEFSPVRRSLVWGQRCVPVYVRREGSVFASPASRAVVTKALAAWSASCSDFRFVDAGDAVDGLGFDGLDPPRQRNIIASLETPAELGQRGVDRNQVASTVVSYHVGTGELLDMDIVVNAARFEFSDGCDPDKFDLGSALLYSLGIGLGLLPSSDPRSALFRTLDPCELRRQLSPRDSASLCALYPIGRAPNPCLEVDLDLRPGGPELPAFRDQCARAGVE